MNLKAILIIVLILGILGTAVFLMTSTNQFSLTGAPQSSENIEYDTQSPCSDTNDCLKLTDFPKDGYCMEGTCRMKIDTSQLSAIPGGQ